ncbi:MAG: HEAT repeat domain-containing protein [Treponema sp.]|nr:HEAT repeat domain-containing protein [Treponema sp.]
MKVTKLFAAGMLFLAVAGTVSAQSRTEKTVEEDYLVSIEDVIITELSASPEYDNKFLALQYLENALSEGRTSPDMVAALRSLAGEGVTKKARTNGRLMNNYPDIRKKACELLGQVGTEDAKNTLVQIVSDDQESMVVAAAVHSLGDIGLNENDEVVNAIEFMQRKFAALNPSSSLALEILFAYEKLADSVQDRGPMIESIASIAQNYRFATTVRTKAYDLIRTLQSR